jgi:hypothetical protein
VNISSPARLAQSVERKALNLVVVGSSPTVGELFFLCCPVCTNPDVFNMDFRRLTNRGQIQPNGMNAVHITKVSLNFLE